MRVIKFLAIAGILLALAAPANAAVTGWFEAAGTNASSGVGAQGSDTPGSGILDLTCFGPGRCEWDVTFFIRVTAPDANLAGYSLQLTSGAPGAKIQVKETPGINFTDGLNTTLLAATGASPGPILDVQRTTTGPTIQPGVTAAFNFVLSKNKLPGELQTDFIDAGTGTNVWGNFPGSVALAGNPPVVAPPGGMFGSVIQITNTPEPGTIVLLGMGTICLLRRRR